MFFYLIVLPCEASQIIEIKQNCSSVEAVTITQAVGAEWSNVKIPSLYGVTDKKGWEPLPFYDLLTIHNCVYAKLFFYIRFISQASVVIELPKLSICFQKHLLIKIHLIENVNDVSI